MIPTILYSYYIDFCKIFLFSFHSIAAQEICLFRQRSADPQKCVCNDKVKLFACTSADKRQISSVATAYLFYQTPFKTASKILPRKFP